MNRSQSVYRWSLKAAGYAAAIIGFSIMAAITYWMVAASLESFQVFIGVVFRLALLTISLVVLMVAANIGQKLLNNSRAAYAAVYEERMSNAVQRIVTDPSDPTSRTALSRYAGDLETMRTIAETLSPEQRNTLINVLNELDAGREYAIELDSALSKWGQVRAALILGWLSSPQYISALRKAVAEPDEDVALAAAQALANLNSGEAYSALISALESGHPDRIRLVSLMEASPFSGNTKMFQDELAQSSGPVRYWIAYLLRKFPDPAHLDVLYKLTSDDDPNVRARATESLGEIGEASFGPVLSRLLSDSYWFVRAQAATAIGRCGLLELAPSLIPLLRDEHWWVRQDATLALKRLGRQVAPIIEPLLFDEDRFARNKAAEILVALGIVQNKITELRTSGPRFTGAVDFLVAIGRAEAINVLHEEIVRAEPRIKLALVEILELIGDPRSIPVLEALSNDPQPDIAQAASNAAGVLKDQALSA